MGKHIGYKDVEDDPLYKKVVAIAVQRLKATGMFQKDEVVNEAGLKNVGESLRWDHLKLMIEKTAEVELIPMAAAFFARHTKALLADLVKVPARFIAGVGHAKKCVGYCIATEHNGQFIVRRLEHKRKLANGIAKSANREYDSAVKLGVPVLGQHYKIPIEQQAPAPQITGPNNTQVTDGTPAESPADQS